MNKLIMMVAAITIGSLFADETFIGRAAIILR